MHNEITTDIIRSSEEDNLVLYLKNSYNDAVRNGDDLNATSWGDEYGILISAYDAKLIVDTIEQSNRNAQPNKQLKSLLRIAYLWGRDYGEGKSEKGFNDLLDTPSMKEALS